MGHYISDAEGNLTKIAGKDYKAYMPLGMVFASAVMLEEISVKRLDGQSLSITGTYKDFCNWVINQGANAPICNISTYASEMTTYGQCGKFVINNTASAQTSGNYTVPAYSIKLPTITEFIASNNGGDAIGLAELDEFKSHTHGVNIQQGVYTVVQNGSGDWCATYSNNYTLAAGGEETRPKNIRYPYYIVVAQGVKPIALADMQQTVKNVEELQDKCEKVEVIYDQSSSDSNINWGYTSGIMGGTTINNLNFSKYKKLIFYCKCFDLQANAIMSLDSSHYGTYHISAINDRIEDGSEYRTIFNIEISSTKDSLINLHFWQNTVSKDGLNTFIIIKIEGVY